MKPLRLLLMLGSLWASINAGRSEIGVDFERGEGCEAGSWGRGLPAELFLEAGHAQIISEGSFRGLQAASLVPGAPVAALQWKH